MRRLAFSSAGAACRRALPLLIAALGAPLASAASDQIEEIVVTARLLPKPVDAVAASVSVLPSALIRERQANHFEELLNAAPNVNYSAGASRGRFVQIRGIGERSQFVDPVDPSVGLYIDGIDFSGLGNAGTLFDVDQVEVLRGPQGTAFGASAMAGLINIRSSAPSDAPMARVEGGVSEYGGSVLGAVASGPLTPELGARVAVHRNRSDGYIENDHLGRDDTNDIDETTARARLDWQASETLALGLTLMHVDADNGYDAWSLDDNRHTLSDEPGRDRQQSDAVALRADWTTDAAFDVQAVTTWMGSDLDYGYDEDWSYTGLCDGTPCEYPEYSSTDRYIRDVASGSLDLRLVSHPGELAWVAGLYAISRDTTLERRYTYTPARFHSDYDSGHVAAYAELDWAASERLSVSGGLRLQRFEADYDDSLGLEEKPGENLWGGQLSVQYELDPRAMVYAMVARGYKAGGVNGEAIGKARSSGLDEAIIAYLGTQSEFDAETLYNYELGWKFASADARLRLRTALFWMDRNDMQLKDWYVQSPDDEGEGVAPVFVGYTGNAASGSNYGLELETDWQAHERLRIDASLGLLDTEIGDFVANDPDLGFVDKDGREQAQAPDWQFHVGAELALFVRGFARVEYEGKDSYYLSDSDDERSDAYRLLHLAAGYRGERVAATAWLRNALDEDYAVHGFYFGNDPRKSYVNEPYYQYGAPRVAGVTLSYSFE
jgi:iron complex outermembrane recepter protein